MSLKHFIYGVPGVGKSTIARELASKHGYTYIELDKVRAKTKHIVSKESEPFIYEYSTEAWKKFGDLNKESAVKGFLAVREAFQKYIAEELNLYGIPSVAEAVYVDPNIVIKDAESTITLVITSDESLHYSHFFLHRGHSEEEDNQFKAARYIQSYLIEEASSLGINILENNNLDLLSLNYKEL